MKPAENDTVHAIAGKIRHEDDVISKGVPPPRPSVALSLDFEVVD